MFLLISMRNVNFADYNNWTLISIFFTE